MAALSLGVVFKLDTLEHSGDSVLNICFDSDPSIDTNRSPKFIVLKSYQNVRSLELKIEGFNNPAKSSDGKLILTGEIFIVISRDNNEVENIKLHTPVYNFKPQGKNSHNEELRYFQNFIQSQLKDSFYKALTNLNKSEIENKSLAKSAMTFKSNLSLLQIKLIYVLGFIITLIIIVFALSKTVQSVRTATLKPGQLDPTRLVDDHDVMMNKALRDMGIDPDKIKNDMSCFVE